MIHIIKQAENKKFSDYNEAINYLIELCNSNDELNSFVSTEINSGDDIQLGNEILPAIDVFDFLN